MDLNYSCVIDTVNTFTLVIIDVLRRQQREISPQNIYLPSQLNIIETLASHPASLTQKVLLIVFSLKSFISIHAVQRNIPNNNIYHTLYELLY